MRPIAEPDDPLVVCSPADCRILAYESVKAAQQLWIKGSKFSIASKQVDGHAAFASVSFAAHV